MAIYEEIVQKDYVVVGSPSIAGNPLYLSASSKTAYIKNTKALPSSVAEFDFITKFNVLAYRGLPLYIMSDVSENRSLYIHQSSNTLTFYDSSNSYVNGTTTLSAGSTYWFRMRVSGSRLDLYTLDDSSGYSLNTLPPLSEWTHEVTKSDFVNNLGSKTLCLGANPTYATNSWLNGRLFLESTQLSVNGQVDWKPVVRIRRDVSGSIDISKGYTSDGYNKINMPASTYNFDALTANQTLGGKNKLFAYTDSTDSVGALITSTTPTGSFKITKDLEHPVYLDPTKNYIAGGELIEPTVSFVGTDVSSTKALQYSEAQDTTYWIPSEATVSLDSVKAVQSVGPVNDSYLTSLTSNPTASLSFSDDGEIVGADTKLPLKQKVYLNNETDKILGVQERPDEIVITGGTTTENYTVVGSPTISDDYVASNFSSSSYCTTTLPSISNSFTLISRVYLPATVVATGSYGTTFSTNGGNSCYGIINASGTLYTYINGGSESGTKVQMTSGWKWLRMELTSSSTKMYTIDDNNYTEETLPPLSSWTESCVSSSNILAYFSDTTLFIGINNFQSKSTANWQIDLKNTKYIADGVEWRAATVQNGITVSGWSALYSDVTGFTGNTALDYTTPVIIDASSLDIPTDSGTNYGRYLYYTNGDMKCIVTARKVLAKTAYTGYSLSIRDGVIQRVTKRGELCAAFVQRGYDRSTRRYLFIPAANLKEGSFTTRAGEGFYDMSVQGTLPPSEVGASMSTVTYNSNDKTVVMEDNTFDYIGDMMCRLVG